MSENINSTNYYILSPEPYCLNDKLNGIDYPDVPYGTYYVDYDSCGSSSKYGVTMRYCGLDGWTDVYNFCTSSSSVDDLNFRPPDEMIQKVMNEESFLRKQYRKMNDHQGLIKYKDILDHTKILQIVYLQDKNLIPTRNENIENYQNSEKLDNFMDNVCSFQYGPFTKTVTPEPDVIYSMIDSNEKYIYFKCIRDHGSNKIDIIYENDSNIFSVNVDCENDDWSRANSNNSFIYKHTCPNQDKIIYGFCENNEIIFTNDTCDEIEEPEEPKETDESSGISWWIWLIIIIISIIIIIVIIFFVYNQKQNVSVNKNT